MRVLFFSNIYPNPFEPHRGTYNRTLVRALAECHDIHVISPIAWTIEVVGRRRGVRLPSARRVNDDCCWVDHPRYYYTPKVFRPAYAEFMWHSVRHLADRVVAEFNPDIVVADWAHPDGEVAARIARSIRIPSIVIVGGSDVLVLSADAARRESILRALNSCDVITPVSDNIRRKLMDQGIDPARLNCIHRGIDARTFSPGDRFVARHRLGLTADPILFWAGNLVPIKGVDVLLQAATLLRDAGRRFQLFLAGRGALRGDLEEFSKRLGLQQIVTFLGPKTANELTDWYRAADLTLISSRSEGIPNVLLESIACGTPFVATNVGGIAEIADPALDRLVRPDDPAALATAIAASLDERCRRENSRRRYRPWSSADAARQFTELFARVKDRYDSVARACA